MQGHSLPTAAEPAQETALVRSELGMPACALGPLVADSLAPRAFTIYRVLCMFCVSKRVGCLQLPVRTSHEGLVCSDHGRGSSGLMLLGFGEAVPAALCFIPYCFFYHWFPHSVMRHDSLDGEARSCF